MDVFDLRERVIERYAKYVRSFFTIREETTKRYVERHLDEGKLWPEPLIQLNPSFWPGKTMYEELRRQNPEPADDGWREVIYAREWALS